MPRMPSRIRIDGVAVTIDDNAVLLRGKSGSGRSDLALRLIDQGARLISDEQVELERRGAALYAMVPSCMPEHLLGHLEARGLGIVPVPHVASAFPLCWVVDMAPMHEIDRLPVAEQVDFLGVLVPSMKLDPSTASATAKLRLAVKCGPNLILGRG